MLNGSSCISKLSVEPCSSASGRTVTNRSSISDGKITGCSDELDLACFDLRQVEHIVHQLEQMARRLSVRCRPSLCLSFSGP